jgi:signal transduction histidine kinase
MGDGFRVYFRLMNTVVQTAGWARRYRLALQKHLAHGSHASLEPALGLGRQAVKLGLETLDLARVHKQVLASLALRDGAAPSGRGMAEKAKCFFTEVIVPIEKTHLAAMTDDARITELNQALQERVAESVSSTRHLENGIARRKAAESALKKSGNRRIRLVRESGRLQNRLRKQTRKVLSAQENERRKMSRQLHDEIAQTLLGIHVWLLTLKTLDKAKTKIFKKEIANTQRLVKQFINKVNRFAHAFVIQP